MFSTIALLLLGAALLYMGVDIVKKEPRVETKRFGGAMAIIGFVLCLGGVVLYPYLNVHESRLAGEAEAAKFRTIMVKNACALPAKLKN